MKISDITSKELINLNLKGKTKKEVILELVKMLKDQGKIDSISGFAEDVFERENQCTTGFGKMIAIPHGKSSYVKESCVAIGKCSDVDWQSLDGKPVTIVMLIAVPKEKASTDHLVIISKLAEKLIDDNFVKNLLNVSEKEELLKILNL
ncbi:hypothetical protein AGR56_00160 [Clostridium sp. DMHC 10]|uniref:PTS sugar transporter subunit IIA n=1 Tax=Clostridium sp. DMHC 10 TaxID=747377 RepID=UPI00069D1473|nr:fructose PTS transporter subunit IIA [Clostridium sp. DMHC 10]KOF58274.1 hypothetical protein AGR56_00160 [Clostridium sp. DMHC 10]